MNEKDLLEKVQLPEINLEDQKTAIRMRAVQLLGYQAPGSIVREGMLRQYLREHEIPIIPDKAVREYKKIRARKENLRLVLNSPIWLGIVGAILLGPLFPMAYGTPTAIGITDFVGFIVACIGVFVCIHDLNRQWRSWYVYNLHNYEKDIPLHVLDRACTLKEEITAETENKLSVGYSVDTLIEKETRQVLEDPFLRIWDGRGDESYFIEVWDENDFERQLEKQ